MATLTQALKAFGCFEFMLALLDGAGLDLSTRGPYTLFAPPDETFASQPPQASIVYRHLAPGVGLASQLAERGLVPTIGGGQLEILRTTPLLVSGRGLLQADLRCDNGVLHILEGAIPP
ncbi:MAG: fasciclin domain-containing protein [Candidatus Sericytochromatia bacterium]